MPAVFFRIRNRAIQMFRDLPNGQRQNLYDRVRMNPSTPMEVTDPDNEPIDFLASGFSILMERPRGQANWYELNALIAILVITGMNRIRAMKLFYIIYEELLAMGQNPLPGNTNPPPFPDNLNNQNDDIAGVAGLGPYGEGFFANPATPADRPFAPNPGEEEEAEEGILIPMPDMAEEGILPPMPFMEEEGPMPIPDAQPHPIPDAAAQGILLPMPFMEEEGPIPIPDAAAQAFNPYGTYEDMNSNGPIGLEGDATNAIFYNSINPGNEMVDFHGERGYGRYYRRNTFDVLQSNHQGLKKNPFTQVIIEPGTVRRYTAAGGRKRKQRTARKKTRRSRTLRKKRSNGV